MTRTVVVTGACGGIGTAILRLFEGSGWRTVGLDRSDPDGSVSMSRFIKCDVADVAQLLSAAAELASEERIDALVNNAATAMDKEFSKLSVADWDLTMNTNVRPAFVLTQALLPQLAATSGGVVNVASVHAIATTRGVAAYAASKGALVAFTRAASLDLASSGVRCNAVCPGATDTPMLHAGLSGPRTDQANTDARQDLIERTPLGRVGTPSETAEAILFLADSTRSGYITGQTLIVDGGATSRLSTE